MSNPMSDGSLDTTAKIPAVEMGEETPAVADLFAPNPVGAFNPAPEQGGSLNDYEELLNILNAQHEKKMASELAAAKQELEAYKASVAELTAQLEGNETRIIDQLMLEAKASVDNKIAEVKTEAKSLRDRLIDGARRAWQGFLDVCKDAVRVLRQDTTRAKGMMISFSHVEGLLGKSIEYSNEYIDKLEKMCSSIEEHSMKNQAAKGHFKNALAAFRGRETTTPEPEISARTQELIDTARAWIDVHNTSIDSTVDALMSVDDVFQNAEVANIGRTFGVDIYVDSIDEGSDKLSLVIAGKDIQGAYNALEANPEAAYRAFQASIDPMGDKLLSAMSKAGAHCADPSHEACVAVLANSTVFYNTREHILCEQLPVPSVEQMRSAADAARNYMPLKVHRSDKAPELSPLEAAWQKADALVEASRQDQQNPIAQKRFDRAAEVI